MLMLMFTWQSWFRIRIAFGFIFLINFFSWWKNMKENHNHKKFCSYVLTHKSDIKYNVMQCKAGEN